MVIEKPWASFCMSTYKRPLFLKSQIDILLSQTFANFEIVISDNDPEASGKVIADSFNDSRIKYDFNAVNLGMVKSFNKAIDRSIGEFVVMVTDDDPVDSNMLEYFYLLQKQYPEFSLYSGMKRNNKNKGAVEKINSKDFPLELLNHNKTIELHWSSSLMRRSTL